MWVGKYKCAEFIYLGGVSSLLMLNANCFQYSAIVFLIFFFSELETYILEVLTDIEKAKLYDFFF